MSDSPSFLANRLQAEGQKTAAFFTELNDAQWQTQVYTEGDTWTMREVLAHFVTAERGFLRLFGDILEGGKGIPEDFSIDRYNASQQEKSKDLTTEELLNQFAAVRAQMVEWVGARSLEELNLEGRHPFLGQVTLGDMIKMVYRHNQIHFRDFRDLVK